MNAVRLSKFLSRVLRHAAPEYGIEMRLDGFVRIDALLELKDLKGKASVERIRELVAADVKTRFSLVEENGVLWIRCNQGHSLKHVDADQLLTAISDSSTVPVAVHGTYKENLLAIMSTGIQRMQRQHVHFIADGPHVNNHSTRKQAGIRSSCTILIYVDVERAMADGVPFFVSANNVVLSPGPITRQYFIRVVELLPDKSYHELDLSQLY